MSQVLDQHPTLLVGQHLPAREKEKFSICRLITAALVAFIYGKQENSLWVAKLMVDSIQHSTRMAKCNFYCFICHFIEFFFLLYSEANFSNNIKCCRKKHLCRKQITSLGQQNYDEKKERKNRKLDVALKNTKFKYSIGVCVVACVGSTSTLLRINILIKRLCPWHCCRFSISLPNRICCHIDAPTICSSVSILMMKL